MRRVFLLAVPSVLCWAVSCAFTLDFDKLQKEKPDASVVVGGSAGANGTAGNAGAGGATSVPLAELASALATAACANLGACYASAVRFLIHDEDCQTLLGNGIQETAVATIQQSVADGKLTYDPVKAAECISRLAGAAQASPPVCANPSALFEDCKHALGNLAAADQACVNSADCQYGLRCQLDGGCPGTCRPFGQLGAQCQGDAECDPTQGLYCQTLAGDAGIDAAAMPGTCQAYLPLNAACTPQDQCVPGAFCINNVCRRLTELFTLDEGLECYLNGLFCNPGLACEFTGWALLSSGVCTAPKQPLDSCRLALPGECPKDYYCTTPNAFNPAGQCAALPTENQPCAAVAEQQPLPGGQLTISAPCHAGLVCVNGYCKPVRHLGEACEADAQCYSGACRAGADGGALVCVTPGCG